MKSDKSGFVSRGGTKLRAALDAFGLEVAGLSCADFGANVGGFTDCLLQAGAVRVFAIDTGYGELAWRLRKDPRVVVMERTNALHAECPQSGGVDLVTIDVAFTPQRLIVPAAGRWLRSAGGKIVSLVKPHYELAKLAGQTTRRGGERPIGVEQGREILNRVCAELAGLGFHAAGSIPSPLRGKGGNVEFLVLLEPGL
jgi:23S rRNA (cytidine1920-2'-O)/16S rRNA (cytidine1409-2'-O)-methyltransferase